MKKIVKVILKIVLFVFGIYFLVTNLPNGAYYSNWNNSAIVINITDNFLVFQDPEFYKYITIKDGDSILKVKYWSGDYPMKIYKRQNNLESFWVIEDYHRGVSRSENGEFIEFTCPGCLNSSLTEGDTMVEIHFDDGELEILKHD